MKRISRKGVAKYYTFTEVHWAKHVLQASSHNNRQIITVEDGVIEYGESLYPPEWVEWAKDVVDWFSHYLQIVRLTAKHFFGGCYQLAVKSIWKEYISTHTCAGQIFHTHLRLRSYLNSASYAGQSSDIEYRDITVNPKVQKHRRRSSMIRLTNSIQAPKYLHV